MTTAAAQENRAGSGGGLSRHGPQASMPHAISAAHTPTLLVPFSSGHIGRMCSVCHTCRRFRPYTPKSEYKYQAQANTRSGRGQHYEHTHTR
jgi:hypothetical protein